MLKLKFKKIYNKIFIISLSLSFNPCYAKNYEFKSVQIFGDSLSDMGFNNKVAIADKNNNTLYPQYLSNIFTGKNIKNFHLYDLSGTNHSGIGLTAVTDVYYQYTNNHNALQFTINDFINYQSSSKDNSKNLYIIWAGGNDLTQNILSYVFNNPIPLFQSVSNNIAYQMKRLYNTNAKYIMVANIFSPAIGPLSVKNQLLIPTIIDSVYSAFLQITVLPILILSEIFIDDFTNIDNFIDNKTRFKTLLEARLVAKQDKILRDKDNTFIGQGNDIDLVFNKVNEKSHIRIIDKLLKRILRKEQEVVEGFNKELEASLKSLEKDVVYIDINELYKDIRNNSKFYGIDDIVMPQCSLGMISYEVNDICIKGNKYNHDEKIYMFSDQIHPSGFMHKIFAQYMESIFNAPVMVSSITRQMVNLNTNVQDNVFNQLYLNKDGNISKLTSFVSLSENINNIGDPYNYGSKKSYMSILNIGLQSNINDKFIIGSMLSTSLGHYNPYDNFKYNFNSEILNLFGQLNTQKWILSTNFSFGRIGVNNIKRTIPLGLGKHIESSNTNGNIIGINLNIAKEFNLNDNVSISPVLRLYLNKYHVNAFQEKDNKSTAMKYKNTTYFFKELALGVRSSYTNENNIKAYAQIDIHQPINQLPIEIISGLKNTTLSFTREIASFNKKYLNITTGINKKFSNNLNINSQINFKFDNYHNKNLVYSISLNYLF